MASTLKSYVPALSSEVNTVTGAAHAETLNAQAGIVTTEALTTATTAVETRTLTNNFIQTGSLIFFSDAGGTNTRHDMTFGYSISAAGAATVTITNNHASAINGTVKYAFMIL